jgi:hypothetical protein
MLSDQMGKSQFSFSASVKEDEKMVVEDKNKIEGSSNPPKVNASDPPTEENESKLEKTLEESKTQENSGEKGLTLLIRADIHKSFKDLTTGRGVQLQLP